jgi:hypothetical protein
LVKVRNCAWAEGIESTARRRPVWTRRKIVARQCPKSIITAQSLSFLEQFRFWKELGGDPGQMDAKIADALLVIEREWRSENQHGTVQK